MHKCAFCDNDSFDLKYFACPSYVFRPNAYSVCREHSDLYLKWEDVYPSDGCKPITRHEDKVK